MADIIDYNKLVAQVYETVVNLNTMATSLVGLDATWCRLLPYENGEDVIVQEYTLHQYECPKMLKVVTSKTDYQVGNYSIDLWGMHQELPLEINIDIKEWANVYGPNTMPQKGDFVLIAFLNKPFEVKSSVVVYTIGEQPTSYKCVLGQWQHNANRRESEDFTISIDDITVSQKSLFGDAISEEVADAVIQQETAYKTTTKVDPIKSFDINSVVLDDTLIGSNGNVFSNAYYDFATSTSDITYNIAATYNPDDKSNHWIYSLWFRKSEVSENIGKLTIKDQYLAEKDYQWYNITSSIKIEEGDEVIITRGNLIQLNGVIEKPECDEGYIIRIPTPECLITQKKVPNWWKSGNWKISKSQRYKLLTGYNGDDEVLDFEFDEKNIYAAINGNEKMIKIPKKLELDVWYYIMFDMSPSNLRIVMNRMKESTDMIICDTTTTMTNNTFGFDSLTIENKYKNIDICKVRLYESEYAMEENYQMDMYSMVTHNASKIIVADAPNPTNKQTFVTTIR